MTAKNKVRPPDTSTAAHSNQGVSARRIHWGGMCVLALAGFGVAFGLTALSQRKPSESGDESARKPADNPNTAAPAEMIWAPGGDFTMGTAGQTLNRNEQPAHLVKLDGFWIDVHEVTNAQFRRFVDATGYITTAEKPPDWEEMKKTLPPDTPKPPAEKLVPGSLVFAPPGVAVPTNDVARWWTWTPGACWKHPEGPGSNLDGRDDHPAVQVSWDDANAYAKWASKRLPTEAEWEFAARGGLAGKRFTWGDEPPNEESKLANIWQGVFPHLNTNRDGWERTAPIKSYPPNEYGLYDMAGNVWEWCADWYRADEYSRRGSRAPIVNPAGPTDSWDPNEPFTPKRVTRGGSFLCHVTYCESYRTAARRGTSPDTGMSHLGFRCVKSAAGAK